MNPIQLSAIRQLLFFSVEEAALLVAATPDQKNGIDPTVWRDWEAGKTPIPSYIEDVLIELLDYRLDAIEDASEPLDDNNSEDDDQESDDANIVALWYSSLEDFTSLAGYDALYWRPQCSVVAELIATFGADAVEFNKAAYQSWLGNKQDNEQERAGWAMSIIQAKEQKAS